MNNTKKVISLILSLIMLSGIVFSVPVYAWSVPTRTVMMYCVGADLESDAGCASYNLIQAMESDYNENLNFIVITGGAKKWTMSSEYLSGATKISSNYNQVWLLSGKQDGEEHGVMTLLEETGIAGFGDKYMSDASMLTGFIDYCYENYSADVYDIVLWNHGGGPVYGFGHDEHSYDELSLMEMADAFSATKMYEDEKRFEFIDYDACLMGNTEIVASLCDFTDYFICSADDSPSDGQYYTDWLNAVNDDPYIEGYEIGKNIVDEYVTRYEADGYTNSFSTLSLIDSNNFKSRLLPRLNELCKVLYSEATTKGNLNGIYNFYDEIYSVGAMFEYGEDDTYDLFDLSNLMAALGSFQTEADNLNPDDIKNYQSPYKALAVEVLNILCDNDNSGDDVIYSGLTSRMYITEHGRNLLGADGELSAFANGDETIVFPTGLSIFFPSTSILYSYDYVDELMYLADSLTNTDAKTFIENYIPVVAYFGLISAFGDIVSEMEQGGEVNPTYSDIKSELQSLGKWSSYYKKMMKYLVSVGEFSSLSDAEEFFAEIVSQQSGESVTKEKTSVFKIKNGDDEKNEYIVKSSDTSAHTFTDVYSAVKVVTTPNDATFKSYLFDMGYSYYSNYQFPDGYVFYANRQYGERINDAYIENYGDSDEVIISRAFGSDETVFTISEPQKTCLAVYDEDQNAHIADATYLNNERTKAYIPIVVFDDNDYGDIDYYYLFVNKADGVWKIEGLSKSFKNKEFIATDNEIFNDDLYYTTVSLMRDSLYNYFSYIPISNFTKVSTDAENWGMTVLEVTPSDLDLENYTEYYLRDVYSNEIEITDLIETAELNAENGEVTNLIDLAEIKAQYNINNEPVIRVIVGDKTLIENTDYRVLYNETTADEDDILIIGMGDYLGKQYASFSDEIYTDTETDTDTNTETETDTDTQTETDTETDSEVENDTETVTDTDTDTNTDTETDIQTDSDTDTETDLDTDTDTDTDAEPELKGDISGDGIVDIIDIVMARSHIVGNKSLDKDAQKRGDMNDDNTLDIIDIVMMRKQIVG